MISFSCDCERKIHKAPVEKYVIEPGAIFKTPEILADFHNIYMVCDETTYQVAGMQVEEILTKSGQYSHKLVLPKDPLPDNRSIGDILIHLQDPAADNDIFAYSPQPDLILAVGTGTVNDSCRVVSYRLGIPYAILGTAPSMDGFASAGSPTLFDGSKATIKCTTPRYIIADTELMRHAPMEMLLAGIGDMFGKYTGILDWELARDYKGEYYCKKIADDVIEATNLCLENGYALKDRSVECIANIMNGFMVTGLGMAYTGNSRPASGAEHIVSHVWELKDVAEQKVPNLHGIEVCEATRIIADMYRMLYKETEDQHLKELIGKYIPYFDKIEEFCKEFNMPNTVRDPDWITESILKALPMRDRYTILYYLGDRGLLERYARTVAEEYVKRI